MRGLERICWCVLLVSALAVPAVADVVWYIEKIDQPIGTTPDSHVRARDINELGEVAGGYVRIGDNTHYAFRWADGVTETVSLDYTQGGYDVLDFNDAGNITGTTAEGNYSTAYAVIGSTFVDINALSTLYSKERWLHSVSVAINNSDWIAGAGSEGSMHLGDPGFAFYWTPADGIVIVHDYDAWYESAIKDVNDNAQMLVDLWVDLVNPKNPWPLGGHSALWEDTNGDNVVEYAESMFFSFIPRTINNLGHVAGSQSPGAYNLGWLWDGTQDTPIPGPPGFPMLLVRELSDLDQAVGTAKPADLGYPTVPFFFDGETSTNPNDLPLSDVNWEIEYVNDINNHGQICGYGSHAGGYTRSFIMTPIPVLTPELAGAATGDVVYDPYGGVGDFAAGLPEGSELVGGTVTIENFELLGDFCTMIMYYDERDLVYQDIDETTLRLYWYDDVLEQWLLAGNESNNTYNPAAMFIEGTPTTTLGDWGVNIDDDYVWANVDHASAYGMASVPPPQIIQVQIDIKPGSDDNPLNLGSEGVVPVAILGSQTLDVEDINQGSLMLAGNAARRKGKNEKIGSFTDVNDDGQTDLVVQFPVDGLELSESDTVAEIEGLLKNGTPITGSDTITVVPPQ